MRGIALALTVILIAAPSYNTLADSPEWHMVNVNTSKQGDAHLLIDSGVNTLIDAGSSSQAKSQLVPYLRAHEIATIHHLFISHPHTDHYGGLDALLNASVAVKNVYYNLPPIDSNDFDYKRTEFLAAISRAQNAGAQALDVSAGFGLILANSRFKVLHAQKESMVNGRDIDINDYSIILQWDADDFRTIFTGDLNARLGAELAKRNDIKADVLKVPHHGVSGIAPNSFFDAVNPSLAMFPSTADLWVHQRGEQAKNWVKSKNISYCHNGLNGNVVLTFNGPSLTVKSNAPSAACPSRELTITPIPKMPAFHPAILLMLDHI